MIAINFLTPGAAAKILELSSARVRQLSDSGHIRALKMSDGRRLLITESVHLYAKQRVKEQFKKKEI